MPRVDKIGTFRKLVNENETNDKLNTDNSKDSDNSNEKSEISIDFTPYLREPRYTLDDDVVLPKTTRHQIDLILAEMQYQDLIYNEWGMGEKHKMDKSLSVNFSGPPGTGKTLSAEALAHAIKQKILIVPYHQLESKFVGETPKNIVGAFEFATEHDALLFFDEADSFLGKRLENVTQATDTAVNLTRSVMLMQLSSYQGIVIFATNLISNYDPAFVSRIRRRVQFDLPDEEARRRIWQAQIPSKLPLDESVNYNQLASQFEQVSGRDIKNAVFHAVVEAARNGKKKSEKKVEQLHFVNSMKDIMESNKVVSKSKYTLTPVESEVELPPDPLTQHNCMN